MICKGIFPGYKMNGPDFSWKDVVTLDTAAILLQGYV